VRKISVLIDSVKKGTTVLSADNITTASKDSYIAKGEGRKGQSRKSLEALEIITNKLHALRSYSKSKTGGSLMSDLKERSAQVIENVWDEEATVEENKQLARKQLKYTFDAILEVLD